MTSVDTAAKRRLLVEWLNSLFPSLNISLEASEEELRAHLFDGIVLCGIVNRQDPAFLENQRGAFMSSEQRQEKVRRFLLTVERMGLPSFTVADLENGPTSAVVDCLLSLRNLFNCKPDEGEVHKTANYRYQALKKWVNSKDDGEAMDASHRNVIQSGQSPPLGEENNNNRSASRFSPVFGSPIFPEKTVSLSNAGRKPNELQLKHGLQYTDTSTTKVFEMIKSNGLVNAPVQSLLTVIHGILNESINRKNREIPLLAASLLRKVMHEIERRILTQEEHIRNQNDLIKAPEERHQSRIKEFETMASGTNEETQVQKTAIRESKKNEQQNALQLLKENERNHKMILELKQELEINNMYEHHNQQFDAEAKQDEAKLQERIKEVEFLLFESSKRMNELEALLQSNLHKWNKKDYVLPKFNTFQSSLKKLKTLSESIRVEVINSQRIWSEEMISMGDRLKMFVDAAENYHTVLTENTKLYNEVQELKGNIRVYCRIRPFLPGQMTKLKAVDFSGNNGELVLVNSSRQGKDGHLVFKFNKVFGQTATQVQVFLDIQPLVRSVLDGYNVCIFAYGQTGSGKTYTMSGPDLPSEEEQGVNYRALNDLFHISQERKNAYTYEVGVQMVEIYNEQIRDLLSNNVSQKRLVIFNSSQPHGLVVPDAIMVPVKSSADVLALMEFGQANRAVGSTALNERSSRSHSILTVHVRGVDLKTQSTLRGCLHLIDLAGSERVDRSEVTGDRLKEAQHINKSLSALGDVIFALSQKSAHVPYRNSKLTQILQSSLGGHAKTLMFVHINPDGESYPETLSTLKFAERVSGVELGAARISKEGKDVKDLIEQVASLKDIIARKDDEIEKLQMLKCPSIKSSKSYSLRRFSSSDGISSSGGVTQKGDVKIVKICEKDIPDAERFSDSSIQNSDVGSQLSMFYEGNARNCIFDGGNANKGQHIDDETGEVESDRRLSAVSYSYHSHGEAEYIQDSTIESEVHPESELRPQMCK